MHFRYAGKTYEGVQLKAYRTADLDILLVEPTIGRRLAFVITADDVHCAGDAELRTLARRYRLAGLTVEQPKAVSAA
jgi:hypothetical protein